MPQFSVIIPTYNRAALLREALASVFSQTYTDYEVIVVDDGSVDGTARMVSSYGGNVRYFKQKNQGPGAARNLGIENSTGEYVAFLDSDDVWFPWTLETYYRAICNSAAPAFVTGREVKIKASLDVAMTKCSEAIFTNYSDYLASSRESIWIGTCSVAIRANMLKKAGAFSNSHTNAEDSDLWLRLGTASGFVRIDSPPVFGHRLTPGSEVTNQYRAFQGLLALMETEQLGGYPGGDIRRKDRWRILARHLRPGSINLLREGCYSNAMTLYVRSFSMQFTLGRFKYLFGFWLVFLTRLLTKV